MQILKIPHFRELFESYIIYNPYETLYIIIIFKDHIAAIVKS